MQTSPGNSAKLDGGQVKALRLALLEAYPTIEDFRLMVREELNRSLDSIALGSNLNTIVAKVIEDAEAKGWLTTLLDGARRGSPGSAPLAEVARGILASEVFEASPGNLERIVRPRSPFVPVQDLLDFLERTKRQICRVETKGREALGTAFLVGPDVILTNHHVVSDSIGTTGPDLQVRFDYLVGRDGALPTTGRVYELADTWLLGSAPPSPVDFNGGGGMPTPDELDFALLRLRDPAGIEQVNGVARGWVEIPSSPAEAQPDDIVAVLQHAAGDPLRIAIDTVLSVNANRTRLTYRATTLGGASGSPCFSLARQFVGLHHGGVQGKYNEGIPATALMAWFAKHGLDRLLGGTTPDESRSTVRDSSSRTGGPGAVRGETASHPPRDVVEPPGDPGGASVFNIQISNSTIGGFGAGTGVKVVGAVTLPASRPQTAPEPPPTGTPAGDLASVYLSYGDDDLPFAQTLYESLEAAGVPVFFRHEHAVPGAKVHRSARRSIREYEHVILLCSERSLQTPSVLSELDEMLSREFGEGASERIIPVVLDDFAFERWKPRHPDIRQAVLDRVPLDMKEADTDRAKFEKALKRLLGALRAT